MLRQLKYAGIFLVAFTLLCGVIYPLCVTGIGQLFFHNQVNGSLITTNGTVEGSALIGQPFSDPSYFWGRLSATAPFAYNAAASAGSNLGPGNPALMDEVQARINALKAVDPNNTAPIPVDLVTSSGSGLDPDISVAAVDYQIDRVAQYRNLPVSEVAALVKQYTTGRQFGIFGEPAVNVLKLNLALDNLK